MKKRAIALCLGLCMLLTGFAAASGGTQTDPLISLNYLNNVFYWDVLETVMVRANELLRPSYDEATTKLDMIANNYLGLLVVETPDPNAIVWQESNTFLAQKGAASDTVTLTPGSGLIWTSGEATADHGLLDLTGGSETAAGSALQAQHRYLALEETVITVSSEQAQWSAEGKWHTTAVQEEEPPVVELPEFVDVPEGSWYYDSVYYVVEQKLFLGVSETDFAPMLSMSRGMLTTVLYRMSGSPEQTYSPIFSDVPDGLWYSIGTVWAGQNGVVSGPGDGTFLPDADVARQQIAVILYNYAGSLGCDQTVRGDLSGFTDEGEIAFWAREAMSWAVGVGILQGSDGQIMPNNSAVRAEVAVMLQRFQNWIATA